MKYYTPGPKKVFRDKNYYKPKKQGKKIVACPSGFWNSLIHNRIFLIAVVAVAAVAIVLIVLACAGVFVEEKAADNISEDVVADTTEDVSNLTIEDIPENASPPDLDKYADAETLKYNSEGDEVRALQTRLAELGYLGQDDIVGNYGSKTRIAVLNFQKHNGLQYDGIAGPETQAYIYWEYAQPYEFLFIDGAPTTLMTFEELIGDDGNTSLPEGFPSPDTYKLIADIERETLIVYSKDSAGSYTEPVRYMLCSIGSDLDPGTYYIGSDKKRFEEYPIDGLFRQYWTQIDDSAYITSIKYSRKNASGYLDDSYLGLGTQIEGRSIVLTVPDAKWIWYNVAPQTELVVREGASDDVFTSEIRDQMILADAPEEQITLEAGNIPNTDNWYIGGVSKDVAYIQDT